MKRILTTFTLLAVIGSPAWSAWILGNGIITCAKMVQDHERFSRDGTVGVTQQWIFGFFSGRNFETSAIVGHGKEKALYGAVLEHCRENPLDNIFEASNSVYRQLD